jgi:hypothetical protein
VAFGLCGSELNRLVQHSRFDALEIKGRLGPHIQQQLPTASLEEFSSNQLITP